MGALNPSCLGAWAPEHKLMFSLDYRLLSFHAALNVSLHCGAENMMGAAIGAALYGGRRKSGGQGSGKKMPGEPHGQQEIVVVLSKSLILQ